MYRTDQPTAVAALPTPSTPGAPGFFTGGNPATGQAATIVDADWLNRIQEELIAILEAAGVTPNKAEYDQVLASLRELFAAATGNAEQSFQVSAPPLNDNSSSAAPTNWIWSNIQSLVSSCIGAVATTAGFSYSFGQNGYFKFPSWLAGLIVQWTQPILPASGSSTSSVSITWPIAFPNNIFGAVGTLQRGANSTSGFFCPCAVSSQTKTGAIASGDTLNPSTAMFNQTVPATVIAIGN